MARRRRVKYEFKPDVLRIPLLKKLHLTKLQQKKLLKWSLYAAVCILLLAIQDVVMSQISIRGATTDLVPCAILLITVMEDAYNGSLFALVSSMIYVFSGSAPGPYSIGFLTFLGVGAAVFRQMFWRRGFSSNMLCAGIALMVYELAVYGTGIFLSLTYWSRIGVFLLTGAFSWIVMLALYPLVRRIQKIGGETWTE